MSEFHSRQLVRLTGNLRIGPTVNPSALKRKVISSERGDATDSESRILFFFQLPRAPQNRRGRQ